MAQLSSDQLRAILEDTQASLAAALGRIEAFRIREKQLLAEVSELRQQVHGPPGDASAQASAPAQQEPQRPKGAPAVQAAAQLPAVPSSSGLAQSLAKPEAQWTSPAARAVYVTDCDGDYPVHFIQGAKKVPGSLVVSKEHLDFVEVKARIKQEEFVGITTVKASSGKSSAGRLFLCCAAPAEAPFDSVDSVGACKEGDAVERGAQDGTSTSGATAGVWQMLWSKNGMPQRLVFEASYATRESLHRHTERWLGEVKDAPHDGASSREACEEGEYEICIPKNMMVGDVTMSVMGEPSLILGEDHRRALASVLPPLERMKDWTMTYGTHKHGISLQTLYRKMVHGVPSILVIRDFGGYVFGCYTPDSWRVAPRFYGSGETFVFQLEPFRVSYPWRSMSKVKNDFFMYGTPECLAVGGLGHFAIWVDSDLLHGSSGTCGTFGSPCLSQNNEFRLQYLEVWQALH